MDKETLSHYGWIVIFCVLIPTGLFNAMVMLQQECVTVNHDISMCGMFKNREKNNQEKNSPDYALFL